MKHRTVTIVFFQNINFIHFKGGTMRYGGVVLLGVAIGLLMFSGCAKKGGSTPAPVSYVDNYTVTLTEPKGTSHTGNFFPLAEGYTCNYSGDASVRLTMSGGGITPQDQTTTNSAIGMLKVLPLRPIPLPSGTVSLYPVVDYTNMQSQITSDTSRFFMKDAAAVYVKALKLSDGSYMEVENPIYIKSSLEAGDSWETAPRMDMTKLAQSQISSGVTMSNMTMSAKAKFFVVGMEQVSVPIGVRNAVRLEQASEISMTGNGSTQGVAFTMNVGANLSCVYHFLADTGIIQQNLTGPLGITISAQGSTVTIVMTFNRCQLGLESVSFGGAAVAMTKRAADGEPVKFTSPEQEKYWIISQAVAAMVRNQLFF
jgi:hypothetical protein